MKQNVIDVGDFAAAAAASPMAAVRDITIVLAIRHGVGFAAGAVGFLAAVVGWTVLHGTSLTAMYDAMYPFRLAAAREIAASGNTAPGARVCLMLTILLLTAVPYLAAISAWAIASRRSGHSGLGADTDAALRRHLDVPGEKMGPTTWSSRSLPPPSSAGSSPARGNRGQGGQSSPWSRQGYWTGR